MAPKLRMFLESIVSLKGVNGKEIHNPSPQIFDISGQRSAPST
jgi:hypothetical protein